MENSEMLDDIRAYDEAHQRWAEGEELVPSEVTFAILDGANPIQVWRVYRGLTQQALAEQAGISPSYLSQLESGKRTGTAEVLQAIAAALNLTLDDLLP
ncbi:MAG: helix-turn-helix transcriptional regulator [Anaerolineales bacterium]|nr:helix-turn-helix transcriptional regulator [Anaerolineales bacterium]